jgi:hypothetical protein
MVRHARFNPLQLVYDNAQPASFLRQVPQSLLSRGGLRASRHPNQFFHPNGLEASRLMIGIDCVPGFSLWIS